MIYTIGCLAASFSSTAGAARARLLAQPLAAEVPRLRAGYTTVCVAECRLYGQGLPGARRLSPFSTTISFSDAAAYERMTGAWSRLVGEKFLEWLAPAPGLRWVDFGCGTGEFTRLVLQHCRPARVEGFDPQPEMIEHARRQTAAPAARYALGDAMAAPHGDAHFDVAVMALVLPYVPDPRKGLSEMVRLLAPGGTACAYTWDLMHGGSPLAPLGRAMREMNLAAPLPPSAAFSGEPAMRQLWIDGGLVEVQTKTIVVERRFESFNQLWGLWQIAASVKERLGNLTAGQRQELQARAREHLQQDTRGSITCTGRAIAVRGGVGPSAPAAGRPSGDQVASGRPIKRVSTPSGLASGRY